MPGRDNFPGLEIRSIGGNCPVQAEGTVDGVEFYFRARGSRWSLSIGGEDLIMNPEWYYEEEYGTGPYDAGWMPESEARSFIQDAVLLYRLDAVLMDSDRQEGSAMDGDC